MSNHDDFSASEGDRTASHADMQHFGSVLLERMGAGEKASEDPMDPVTLHRAREVWLQFAKDLQNKNELSEALVDALCRAIQQAIAKDKSLGALIGLSLPTGRPRRDAEERVGIARKVLLLMLDGVSLQEAAGKVADQIFREDSVVQKIYRKNKKWAVGLLLTEHLLDPSTFTQPQIERLRFITNEG